MLELTMDNLQIFNNLVQLSRKINFRTNITNPSIKNNIKYTTFIEYLKNVLCQLFWSTKEAHL